MMNQLQERWQAHIRARSEHQLELAVEATFERVADDIRKAQRNGFSERPLTSGVHIRRRTVCKAA